jgi:hypothetical protein
MKDWVKVADFNDRLTAEIVRNRLEQEDIPAALINKQDSMHLHLNTFFAVELYVHKDMAFRAVQIINKQHDESE